MASIYKILILLLHLQLVLLLVDSKSTKTPRVKTTRGRKTTTPRPIRTTTSKKWSTSCTINPSSDFNSSVLYLEPNGLNFFYPESEDDLNLNGKVPNLRIACPGGQILAGPRETNLTSALVECVGGSTVKLAKTYFYQPFKNFGCSTPVKTVARLTGRKASNGKNIAEFGIDVNATYFLPIFDEVVVSNFKGGYIPRWVHQKVLPVKKKDESSKTTVLKKGALAASVPFEKVYNLKEQRAQLLALYNDTELVDKYIPATGGNQFVASPLVSANDLYYDFQRASSQVYELTSPVWSSVQNGNWKLVSDAVRQLAKEKSATVTEADLDIWTGSYLSLYLPNKDGKNVYVSLPYDVRPPQFLFKYVRNSKTNQAIVFVTVNNPHLTELTENNVICDKLPKCQTQYPEFEKFDKGYTYCCSFDDFKRHAQSLGLPIFENTLLF